MKRRMLIAAAGAALLALAGALWYGRGAAPLTTGNTQMNMREGADFVCASGQMDEEGTLKIQQTFTLTNRSGADLEDIVLRLYANSVGSCLILPEGASVNGDAFDAALDQEDWTLLKIERPWAAGEEIELTLGLSMAAPGGEEPSVVALPVPAPVEAGQWDTAAWDPLAGAVYAPAMDGYLDLLLPEEYSAVFCGEAGHLGAPVTSQKGVISAMIHAHGARGLAFAVSQNGCVRWREIGGVAMSAMAQSVLSANRLLDCAQTALASLEAIGLEYPFSSLSIVAAQSVGADGDVYSGMIVLDQHADEETLLRRMTRLIACQIFGVSVGCDTLDAPWLSYTLASAAELLAFRERKGESAYQTRFFDEVEIADRVTRPAGVCVGAGAMHFGGAQEMAQVLRDEGGAMMMGIGEAIGYDALAQALSLYARENAGAMGSRAALESALFAQSAGSWTGYLEDELYE